MNIFRALFLGLALLSTATVASSAQIGVHEDVNQGDVITLFDDRGDCQEGTGRTLYVIGPGSRSIARRGQHIEGCWVFHEKHIYALYDDGDRLKAPVDFFQWAPGKRPGTPTVM